MPSRPGRRDQYGRPLPTLTDATREDMSASAVNRAQRERMLRYVRLALDEHYPHLLRRDVTAEVTLSFKVVRGTIQDDVYVGIVRHYRHEEG